MVTLGTLKMASLELPVHPQVESIVRAFAEIAECVRELIRVLLRRNTERCSPSSNPEAA